MSWASNLKLVLEKGSLRIQKRGGGSPSLLIQDCKTRNFVYGPPGRPATWQKINLGAKLRCAINEQKWTSMRNVSNSRWWQNGQVWTAVRSWDALKLNKNDPRCGILRIHANSMLWQNDPKWTSVRSWDALKMIKITLGAQCFVFDVVSKMTQN